VALALYLVPAFVSSVYWISVLLLCNYYAALACSWDILSGHTGDLNFGYAFFVGGAGYAAALLNLHYGTPPYLTIFLAGLLAAAFGFIIGALCLKLRGPYFAIVTLSVAAILYKLTSIFWEVLGGEEGLSGIDPLSGSEITDFYISTTGLIFTFLVLYTLSNSRFGLILKAIGENEDTAQASGIPTARYKVLASVISAFFAGTAGSFYVHTQMHVGQDMVSGSSSATIVLMAVVGGMGTIVGPLVGAYLLTFMNEILRGFGEQRLLIYSALVLGIIFISPRGLWSFIQARGSPLLRAFNLNLKNGRL